MVECKYRGRVIGWLVTGADGLCHYFKHTVTTVHPNGTEVLKRWPSGAYARRFTGETHTVACGQGPYPDGLPLDWDIFNER